MDMGEQATNEWSNSTKTARAGVDKDPLHGSVTPALYLSTNYSFEGFGKKRPYDYSRSGNPTRDELGRAIAALEGGHDAVITSSGMAALDLVFSILSPGDLIVAPHDCYGGTYRLLQTRAAKKQFDVLFADLTKTENLPAIFATKPKLVLIETPSNPLLRITDIEAVAKIAKRTGTIVAADNTFLSPVLQKPFDLGADIVIHSTTKYINGHGDVVGGAVVSKTRELHEQFAWWANCTGTTGAPYDSFLTLRGIRTLDLRIGQQNESAAIVADYLTTHPAIGKVLYPGLKTHTGHDIAARQQKGFGAMLSIELKGDVEDVRRFTERLSLFSFAESLGGYESLIAHPATMTHASMDKDAQIKAGITDNLLRLSIGLESPDDLIRDLETALAEDKKILIRAAS
jgi:cystathionine gamma-synthase